MLVYNVTLYSPITENIHSREVYIDSKDKENAERRLLSTFDNIVNYEFLRKGDLPNSKLNYTEKINTSLSQKQRLKEFLKNKQIIDTYTVVRFLGIRRDNASHYLTSLGYKYDKLLNAYVLVNDK